MVLSHRLSLLTTAAAIFLLPWSGSGGASPGIITVCPSGCAYAYIQTAIESARDGQLIKIEPGTYRENLLITQSLTLRGSGQGRSIIAGGRAGLPLILIDGRPAGGAGEPISVRIEGLTIKGARGDCRAWPLCADGVLIRGSSRVSVSDSTISDNGWEGISAWDHAQVEIWDNWLSGNRLCHIGIWGQAQGTIRANQLLHHGDDAIALQDLSQAQIQANLILGDSNGVTLRGHSQAVISDNQIFQSERDGIQIRDWAQASIIHNQISANGGEGVELWRSAQMTLASNLISQNENGLLLGRNGGGQAISSAQLPLTIWGNRILRNRGWGIAVYAPSCDFAAAPSQLEVTVEGSANLVQGNRRGELCPPAPGPPWPAGFLAQAPHG